MIKSGIVSVTFRNLTYDQIIDLVVRAGLDGIEWGGDIHAPHGDIVKARQIAKETTEAGLSIPSYGSYYQVGESPAKGLDFACVLETALALEAKTIRVWAGTKGTSQADDSHWDSVCWDARRIANQAAKEDINIAFEYHSGTLTDNADSACKLIKQINLPNVHLYWQSVCGLPAQENLVDLAKVIPYVTNIHVFHWWPTHHDRCLLSQGTEDWASYFNTIESHDCKRFALLEFVKDDLPENFCADAKTLKAMLIRADAKRPE